MSFIYVFRKEHFWALLAHVFSHYLIPFRYTCFHHILFFGNLKFYGYICDIDGQHGLFFGFVVCFSMSEFLESIDLSSVASVNNGADMSSEVFDSSPFSPCLFSSSARISHDMFCDVILGSCLSRKICIAWYLI